MDDVKGTATQYHNTHDALLARLTDLEQRLAKKPPVGTELEVVIKQLKEQKVCVSFEVAPCPVYFSSWDSSQAHR